MQTKIIIKQIDILTADKLGKILTAWQILLKIILKNYFTEASTDSKQSA